MRSCLAAFVFTLLLIGAVIGVGAVAIGQLRIGLCAGEPLRVVASLLGGGLVLAGLGVGLLALLNRELFEKSLSQGLIILLGILLAFAGLGVASFLTYRSTLASCPRVDQFASLPTVCQGEGLQAASNPATPSAEAMLASTSSLQSASAPAAFSADRLVVIGEDGASLPWTETARGEWAPKSLDEIALVVCASPVAQVRLETCEYGGGIRINRYRAEATVRLVEAQTGRTLAAATLDADPPACQPMGLQELGQLRARVTYADLKSWVGKVIAGEPAPGVTPSPTAPRPTATATLPPTPAPSLTPTPQIEGAVLVASRVRAGPSTNDAILGGLLKGDKVLVTGANGDRTWLKIVTPTGEDGWIFAELVRLPVAIDTLPAAP
jgi:hypothetical protein